MRSTLPPPRETGTAWAVIPHHTMSKLITGVLIDPISERATEVQIPKGYRPIVQLLEVELLELFNASRYGGPDIDVWVDECGMLRENKVCWMASWGQLLAGRAFVTAPSGRSLTASQREFALRIPRWIPKAMSGTANQLAEEGRAQVITSMDQMRRFQADERDRAIRIEMLMMTVTGDK